jgi:DNA-binding response OmpR family regulator
VRGRLLLVRDGLDGAVPWISQVLSDAGLNVTTVARTELAIQPPADAVLIRIQERTPVATCWNLHRQGHRSVIAVSSAASSQECIRLLNAGADYYLDAWMPAAELVARIRVVLRFSGWLDHHAVASPDDRVSGSLTT